MRSAMPGFIAKELCPHLVFVRSDGMAIRAAADAARRIFADYDPNFSSMSMDEAKLDITDYLMKTAAGDYSQVQNGWKKRKKKKDEIMSFGTYGGPVSEEDAKKIDEASATEPVEDKEIDPEDTPGVIERKGRMTIIEGLETQCQKINQRLAQGRTYSCSYAKGPVVPTHAPRTLREEDGDADDDEDDETNDSEDDAGGLCRAERVVAEMRASTFFLNCCRYFLQCDPTFALIHNVICMSRNSSGHTPHL